MPESNCCPTPRLTIERRCIVQPITDDLPYGGAVFKYRIYCGNCGDASRWMWE